MKISIKELQEMVREELAEASGRRRKPPAWSGASGPNLVPISPETEEDPPDAPPGIRSYLDKVKHEMRPSDKGQRLGQTHLGPELDDPSPEELAADAALQAYYGIGGGDRAGLYSKLSKIAVDHEKHLRALQGHRKRKDWKVDEILLILKQLKATIEDVKP